MGAFWGWVREAVLAAGLITLLIIGLWVSTGSMPPMVVVESQSMMHGPQGEVGAIDPGDLVLVMAQERPKRLGARAMGRIFPEPLITDMLVGD